MHSSLALTTKAYICAVKPLASPTVIGLCCMFTAVLRFATVSTLYLHYQLSQTLPPDKLPPFSSYLVLSRALGALASLVFQLNQECNLVGPLFSWSIHYAADVPTLCGLQISPNSER